MDIIKSSLDTSSKEYYTYEDLMNEIEDSSLS